jgi:phage gp16-like protein
MKPVGAEALRKRELAMIHVAKKQLALPDDEYRGLLLAVTGKSSSADLDWQGRKNLLEHFKKAGFKVAAKSAGRARPAVGVARTPLMGKIEALLADSALPWSYADGIVKRLFANTSGVERIEFCDPAHLMKVVAALSIDAKRRARKNAKPVSQESE